MSQDEQGYLDLLQNILDTGIDAEDRTGVGTISVFGTQTRFDLTEGFPLLTTKAVAWKSVVSELLWFIEGSGDERRLAEIRFDDDRENLTNNTTIWTQNAEAGYWKDKAKFPGDLGRVYGVQWRDWRTPVSSLNDDVMDTYKVTDQLTNLIDGIKKDPQGRRHLLTAWNPGELDQMALPPCHVLSQFYVRNGELSCQLYIRSNDMFLGSPFNIASYSLLTLMVAHVCGLKPKEFILTIGDAHIYRNHIDQVKEQLSRDPLPLPTVTLNPEITDITKFTMKDILLHNYESHKAIKAPMAV
jgi:thymidylate synthase